MLERAIVIFPKINNDKTINDIRNKYDPLASLISPHITLVFPFKSDYTKDEIKQKLHLSLSEQKAFNIELCGISKHIDSYGNYLFLNLTKGNAEIKRLYKSLYRGIFNEDKDTEEYNPHITVGNLNSPEMLEDAYKNVMCMTDVFHTIIDTISIVVIEKNGQSIVEIKNDLDFNLV